MRLIAIIAILALPWPFGSGKSECELASEKLCADIQKKHDAKELAKQESQAESVSYFDQCKQLVASSSTDEVARIRRKIVNAPEDEKDWDAVFGVSTKPNASIAKLDLESCLRKHSDGFSNRPNPYQMKPYDYDGCVAKRTYSCTSKSN